MGIAIFAFEELEIIVNRKNELTVFEQDQKFNSISTN